MALILLYPYYTILFAPAGELFMMKKTEFLDQILLKNAA